MKIDHDILQELGWDSHFSDQFERREIPDAIPARIATEQRQSYQALSEYGELTVEISGKLRHQTLNGEPYPAVGDWVVVKPQLDEGKGVIHAVLPRKSKFSRKVAGIKTTEQIVAANVDTVFIVSGLDGGRSLNMRRLERYLVLAWDSGALPVIVLNKLDLCPDVAALLMEMESVVAGLTVHPVSAKEKLGLESLHEYIARGQTVAFLGSSGVGKSALINALLGTQRQTIGNVREDDRQGKHTTTRRELIRVPEGGVLIDTPGMREIQLWGDEENLKSAFEDIDLIAKDCRFTDCQHLNEPGCAISQAISNGNLDAGRFQSYQKLQREIQHLEMRQSDQGRLEEKTQQKNFSRMIRQFQQKNKSPRNRNR
jgi:ribosome biogenesis GTPase / thiamine phosphate phosphatase